MSLLILLVLSGRAQASEVNKPGVINLVNQAREINGLDPLVENYQLSVAALGKLQDMFQNDYFAHISPKNVTPWRWIEDSGYDYKYAGENLAIDFNSVEAQHRAWMQSPDHRKNILNPKFQEIGVAFGKGFINGEESLVTVQMFGAREDFKVAGVSSDKESGNVNSSTVENKQVKAESLARGSQVLSLPVNNGQHLLWLFFAGMLASILALNPLIVAIMWVNSRMDVGKQKIFHVKVTAVN